MDAIDSAAAPVRLPSPPAAAPLRPAASPSSAAGLDRLAASAPAVAVGLASPPSAASLAAVAEPPAAADLATVAEATAAADLATVAEPPATADLATVAEPSAAQSRPSARAWIIWSAAVTVYFVAVFNRSSLGVAGPDAETRFGINAASLSTFSMLQLLVYAAMQIPVGLLVDRYGPRRLLVTGLAVMCVAQAAFAAVGSFALALVARGLLGCGDAMVFISVLRIVAAWFPSRRVALVTQLTSLAGAAGGIASAWPLAWALRTLGWSGTFLAVALIGAFVLVLPAGIVRDTPQGVAFRAAPRGRAGHATRHAADSTRHAERAHLSLRTQRAEQAHRSPGTQQHTLRTQHTEQTHLSLRTQHAEQAHRSRQTQHTEQTHRSPGAQRTLRTQRASRIREQMRAAWSRPQTRLGLWIHFTTGFPAAVFSLLWGYPFLVRGEGAGPGLASALLTLLICANMVCCFVFGVVLTRRPDLRVPLALAVVGCTALVLAGVLLWPGRAPLWLLIVLVLVYASNGAGSMIAFDVARSASPPEQLGTASGMVNIGTFLAAAITLVATGFLVDATGAEHAATAAAALSGFKAAFCFPFTLLGLGTFQIVRISRSIRRPGSTATFEHGQSLTWSYRRRRPLGQD